MANSDRVATYSYPTPTQPSKEGRSIPRNEYTRKHNTPNDQKMTIYFYGTRDRSQFSYGTGRFG
ncbi:hypothetical protein [Allocoleopsis sp.]|uniref:hypothetical protein n=1 Tax=Allocoleopsis sp. TaxID=3088169 RepID=UPI002FD1B1B1